ncbi:FxsA family protein [Novispirillum itersonii]|uniref:UPF0716 protein FxsA n=1 Tax=Novispirillum itersonii TaxID=189 RepID=A0A7X0DN04_NOVIT|nr:FxsA family protein [Novispirillum itersonii]MBB6209732.1 UPF0716 protein FxsA [Novispirillum itersonii]
MAPLILILLIALPFLEIAGFIIVGDWLGALPTLGLLILSMLAGSALLRGRGLGAMLRTPQGRDPSRLVADLGDTLFLALAGLLLLIPGFVTDLLALPLLLPPVRKILMVLALHRLTVVSSAGVGAAGMGPFGGFPPPGGFPGEGGADIEAEYRDVTDRNPPEQGASSGAATRPLLSPAANRDRSDQPFNGEPNP